MPIFKEVFPLTNCQLYGLLKHIVLSPFIIVQCTGGTIDVGEMDIFYQTKPNTGQISHADIVFLEFAIPILEKLKEPLSKEIVFQSILHGITRGHLANTPYRAAVLCGTALVLAYTREVLTQKEVPYPEGKLDILKNELERHKQEHIQRVATELSRLLVPFTILERVLHGIGMIRCGRKSEINNLTKEMNDLLSVWG